MMKIEGEERRVLICAPFGKDAELSATVLERAGVRCFICKNLTEVVNELAAGADLLLTMEDVVTPGRSSELSAYIAKQPAWSDLPILVLKRVKGNEHWDKGLYDSLGNITILESPIRPTTLISAVRASLRARERQYEVQRADRRKDEFLAMLGHELRNPLAPIGAAAQILERAPDDITKIKAASQIVARQVKHMTSLIDDLLDVARVTRGLVVLDRQTIDLRDILTEALEQVNPIMLSRKHSLHLSLPPEGAFVQGDPKRLVQIFSNVLQNAAKYTREAGRIAVSLTRHGDEILVDISDNGIGMTSEVVSHVFDLFSQAERSADRSQGGLGLGLSLVESLVKSHGGSVQASSEGLGKGSQFTIRLPHFVHARADSALMAGKIDTSQAKTALRILIVDDNHDAADSLAMILEITGYSVSVAYNATDGIEQARTFAPHIGLLDIGLPDMTGNELVKILRKDPVTSKSFLIAVTGYGQQDDIEQSHSAGFDRHFVKPVDVNQLLQMIVVTGDSEPA